MEKLLSKTKNKGDQYAENMTSQRKKMFALAVDGYTNIFCQHTRNNLIQDVLS
jgi:hypothetical protein